MQRTDTPFAKAQEGWIIQLRAFTTPVQLCQAHVKEFANWKNSHEEVECMGQGDSKVMAWCGMVDGRMLAVGWMVDENGMPHSVTSQQYQEMLQQHVWPEV